MYPETKNGATKGNQYTGQKRENDIVSFSQDTANTTQRSKRTIERKVSIGSALSSRVGKINVPTSIIEKSYL